MIMSSGSSSVSQHGVHMYELLSSLLQGEKNATRLWLQAEMDQTVDKMIDSIFNRLTNKLANADLDREETDGERSQMNPSDHVESPQMHHSTTFIPQPSTSTFYLDSHQPHSMIGYEPEFDPEILAQVKREIKEEEIEMELKKMMDNEQNQKSNEQSNHNLTNSEDEEEEDQVNLNTQQLGDETDNREMVQMEKDGDDDTEIDNENDVGLKDNQNDEDSEASRPVINTSRIKATPPQNAQSRVITRQSVKHTKRKQTEHVIQSQVVNDNLEDTEEDDRSSRSVKRSRLTTSNCNTKHILTLTLHCPQVNCPSVFTQDKQLTAHMWNRHLIRPFRCMVKDCNQSFSHKKILGKHIAQSHQSITTQWDCGKCDKHYTTYPILSVHNVEHHQLGHFQCSFLSCTFTGEYRKKVYDHYTTKHRQQTLKCQHCPYETQNSSNLNQHLRVHLKSKPYKCKWSKCKYTSTTSSHISRHIRAIHLVAKPGSVSNGAKLNPKN